MTNKTEMQHMLVAVCEESGLRTDGEVDHLIERISFALKSRSLTIKALELEVAIADKREARANEIIRKNEERVELMNSNVVARVLGPATHICFTPDNTPVGQRMQVSLVSEHQLKRLEQKVRVYDELIRRALRSDALDSSSTVWADMNFHVKGAV